MGVRGLQSFLESHCGQACYSVNIGKVCVCVCVCVLFYWVFVYNYCWYAIDINMKWYIVYIAYSTHL